MAPIIHCVRHAQGYHNLGIEYLTIRDPKLTPLGEQQCAFLKDQTFPDQSRISLITASPMTRTIHTAALTFGPALSSGKCKNTIQALPDAQETSDFPCDTGSDVDILKSRCQENGWPVDLSLLNEGWNVKTLGNRYSPAGSAIRARARDVRKQLREMARELVANGDPDPEIVLVTHGGYLHYFTWDWEDSDKYTGTGWSNTETRAYTFNAGVEGEDSDAILTETMESREKRGKNYPMFDKEQQDILFLKSMQGWEDQGLQNPSKVGLELDVSDASEQERADKNVRLDEVSGTVKVMG